MICQLLLLVLQLSLGLSQLMIDFWENILGEKLIHLDLRSLHEGDGPHIPHSKLSALLEAVDRLVSE